MPCSRKYGVSRYALYAEGFLPTKDWVPYNIVLWSLRQQSMHTVWGDDMLCGNNLKNAGMQQWAAATWSLQHFTLQSYAMHGDAKK